MPLDTEREEHRARDVALGVLRLFTHRGDRLEADQDQDRDAGLDEHEREPVRRDDRAGAGVELEVRRQILGVVVVDRRHRRRLVRRVAEDEGHGLPSFMSGTGLPAASILFCMTTARWRPSWARRSPAPAPGRPGSRPSDAAAMGDVYVYFVRAAILLSSATADAGRCVCHLRA